MSLHEDIKCQELIVRMFKRQIEKPRTYHPTIMREFTAQERKLIFGGSATLDDVKDDIDMIVHFAITENITSPKQLMSLCKQLYPDHIAGAIKCGNPFIEISTDLIPGELLIEVDDERQTLTKEELIQMYRRNTVMSTLTTLAMGDAYGVGFEFMEAGEIRQNFPVIPDHSIGGGPFGFLAGQFSDDTEMAVLTLYSLHRNRGVNETDLKRLYTAWAYVAKDVGIQTRQALIKGVIDYRGEGNGALMRILPAAAYMKECLRWDIVKIHHECEKISALTHSNYTIHALNSFFIDLMFGESLERHQGLIALFNQTDGVHGWVMNSARIVYDALQQRSSLMDGFKHIVSQGGDTDTHCAIYGAIRGYQDGLKYEVSTRLLNAHSLSLLSDFWNIELHRYYPDPENRSLIAGQYPGAREAVSHAIKTSALVEDGVEVVINLMESEELARFTPYEEALCHLNPQVQILSHPIRDMDIPTMEELERILEDLELNSTKKCYVHCWGGHGRTGTVVGAYLIRFSQLKPEDALMRIKEQRLLSPFGDQPSPQTEEQIRFVYDFSLKA